MLLIAGKCPRCHSRVSAESGRNCPHCGASWDKDATRQVRDLDMTTEFRADDDTVGGAEDDDLVGQELGTYYIESFLGQGGMARVYRARHLTLERPCAIKVMKPDIVSRDQDAVAAFLSEARAAANLIHPNVVTIHTIGHDRGRHFIEMEYIEGASLAALLETEGNFPPAQATCFLAQVGGALAVAHTRHLVHRDIKPGNVMVGPTRFAKLSDFGLAKRVQDQHTDDGGWMCGTPNFMAPELFAGRAAGKTSDVYAMGVMYFQLLTGQLPCSAESIGDLVQWHSVHSPPDIRELNADLPEVVAQLLQRCLAKNPEDRYPDATVLHQELRAVYGSLRTLHSLIEESLRDTAIEIAGTGNRYELVVPLKCGRKQRVIVQVCDSAAIAEQVVRVYSICGPADEKHYRRALELNPHFPHGAIGLENIDGRSYFVMTNAFPRATCDPEELRHSILGIAQRADDVERCITGNDLH